MSFNLSVRDPRYSPRVTSAKEKVPLYLIFVTKVSYTFSSVTNCTKVPIFKLFKLSTLLVRNEKLKVIE